MAFTHKLAARLARLKDSVAIVAALAVATIVVSCEHPVTDLGSIIAQLVVSPQNVTLQQNQAEDFLAVGFTATGDSADIAVSWSATGGTIDSSSAGKRHYGHYTSATCGTYTVTATSHPGNVSTAVSVSVTGCPLPVASVSVTPGTATIGVGQTAQYAAITRDAFGNPLGGRTVTWSSSNPAVATVNGAGQATGVAVGAATLTATSEGKSGTAALTVTNVPVASVTVSPASASVPAGQTVQLTVTPRDANGNPLSGRTVTWASSNPGVATVSGSGLVSGVAGGAATITATSEGQSGSSAITVTAPPPPPPPGSCQTGSSVWVNSPFSSQNGSFTAQFDATPNAAPMDGVMGLSAGATTLYEALAVTVRFNTAGQIDARSGAVYTAANAIPYAAGTSYRFRLVVDIPSHTFAAYVTPAGSAELTIGTGFAFRTDQPPVSALDNWALHTESGTHTVCNFTISSSTPPAPVASVTVTPPSATVQAGQTVQLTATLKDANGNLLSGRSVTWSSSNTAVATVNNSGLVSGAAAGSATITATSEGQSGTAAITVTPAPPPAPVASVTVTPASASVPTGLTFQLTATLKDANGNTLTGRTVTWASSNTAVATVSGSGLVSGATVGPATITATSEAQSGTAAITVTPPVSGTVNHVFWVLEENTDYASVTTSSMPYLMGLAAQYGLATQYYANTHPSIGNYLMLTGGQVITNDDNYSGPAIAGDNIVRELIAAGKSWKLYAEDLPYPGDVEMGVDNGTYTSRHNGLVFYTDVQNDPLKTQHVVPFTQLATDMTAGALPNYGFIEPNLCNDAHDCSLGTADSWLQANVGPLLANAQFQQDGLLIVTFDESSGDNTHGGGRVTLVMIGPKVKRSFQSTTLYQEESLLRFTLKTLGITVYPNAAATAPDMSEFLTP